jgi:hypothetical protein
LQNSKNKLRVFLNFSRTSSPKSIKLGTNLPWVKEIQVCSNKGPLQSGDKYKNAKHRVGSIKNLLPNPWANFIQT